MPTALPAAGPNTLQCDTPATGRYLTVQLLGTNILTLCEVQVFGGEALLPRTHTPHSGRLAIREAARTPAAALPNASRAFTMHSPHVNAARPPHPLPHAVPAADNTANLCSNVNCGVNGSCLYGVCTCSGGFTGTRCQTAPSEYTSPAKGGGRGLEQTELSEHKRSGVDKCCALGVVLLLPPPLCSP